MDQAFRIVASNALYLEGVQSLPHDLVQLLTHRSCHFLTSLGVCHHVIYAGVPINDEALQTLTLHRDNSACTHLKFLSIHCRAAQCSQSALVKLIESRIRSCTTSQPQDGLLYLQIVSYPIPDSEPQEWPDEAIKRSEMESRWLSRPLFTEARARMNGIQFNAVCAVLKSSRTTLPAKILLQQSDKPRY